MARTLKKVGLADSARIQLRKFSKGMLQRVGLAQAILHDPELVVLDEPMSGLDPVGRREVRDIILELKEQGKTVFFSTHILSDAEMLCDRVGVIAGGKLQGVGAPSEIVGMKTHGMEILFELPGEQGMRRVLASMLAQAARTGDRYRVQVEESGLYAAIEQLAGGQRENIVGDANKTLAGRIFHARGGSRPEASGGGSERKVKRIGVVALNTFREAVRDRVLYNLVFFALVMMAAAVLVGQISIGIEQIVIVTLGLSAISIIGL